MLYKTDEPFMVHRIEERADVGIQYPAHLPAADPDDERIECLVSAASRSESIRESEELFLVNRIQHLDRRPLDNLVLQRSDGERALPTVRFGYVDPA